MKNEQIIRAWKSKKSSVSVGEGDGTLPANPAGSAAVSMKELEVNEASTSPQSLCSIGPACQCM